jgi:hypothetical protein
MLRPYAAPISTYNAFEKADWFKVGKLAKSSFRAYNTFLLVLTLVEGLIGFSQMSDRISFYKSTLR